MRALRAFSAGPLLLEQGPRNEALVQARLDGVRQREGQHGEQRRNTQESLRCRETPDDERRALRSAALGRTRQQRYQCHHRELRRTPYRDRQQKPCLVAASPLVCRGTQGSARLGEGASGSRPHRHGASRNQLYHSGGTGRPARRYLLHRDLRYNHRACLRADVSAGACDKVDGHKDGAFGRGSRRDFRWLPLLPQGSFGRGVS